MVRPPLARGQQLPVEARRCPSTSRRDAVLARGRRRGRPRRARARPAAGRAATPRSRPRARPGRRAAPAGPQRAAAEQVGRAAHPVATTGRPAASASMSATGVPSLQRRVDDHVEVPVDRRPCRGASRGSGRLPPRPSRAASASSAAALARRRRPPRSAPRPMRARTCAAAARKVGTSLIGDQPPDDADEGRAVRDSRLAAQRAARQRLRQRLQLQAQGDHADAVGGGDAAARRGPASPRRRPRSARACRARGASPPRGRPRCARGRNSRAGRGRGRCAPRAGTPARRAAERPSTPAFAVWVWTMSRPPRAHHPVERPQGLRVGPGPDLAAEARAPARTTRPCARRGRAGSPPTAPPCPGRRWWCSRGRRARRRGGSRGRRARRRSAGRRCGGCARWAIAPSLTCPRSAEPVFAQPQLEGEQRPELVAVVGAAGRVLAQQRHEPVRAAATCPRRGAASRVSSTIGRSSPRNQAPSGTPKPCLGRRRIVGGQQGLHRLLEDDLAAPALALVVVGQPRRRTPSGRGRAGGCAPPARGPWSCGPSSAAGRRAGSVRAFRYSTRREQRGVPGLGEGRAVRGEHAVRGPRGRRRRGARSAARSKKLVQEKMRSSRGSAALRAKRRSAAEQPVGAAGARQQARRRRPGRGGRARAARSAMQHGAEALVAGEGLVAAVAVQRHLHVPARLPRHEVGGQGRGIAEGLVVVVRAASPSAPRRAAPPPPRGARRRGGARPARARGRSSKNASPSKPTVKVCSRPGAVAARSAPPPRSSRRRPRAARRAARRPSAACAPRPSSSSRTRSAASSRRHAPARSPVGREREVPVAPRLVDAVRVHDQDRRRRQLADAREQRVAASARSRRRGTRRGASRRGSRARPPPAAP